LDRYLIGLGLVLIDPVGGIDGIDGMDEINNGR
jgi:hypothetical protein